MALIRCPECGHQVSDTAPSCPNCGYDLSKKPEAFTPVVKPLTDPEKVKSNTKIAEIIGSVILLAVGVATIGIGIGIVLIILGVVAFFASLASGKKVQHGECPYCGEKLVVTVAPNLQNVQCPKCSNVSKYTGTTLESTH